MALLKKILFKKIVKIEIPNESGIGSYSGYHGFIAFSHFKSIYKTWAPEAMMSFMRPPYGPNSVRWLRLLMRKNPKPRWMPNIRVRHL